MKLERSKALMPATLMMTLVLVLVDGNLQGWLLQSLVAAAFVLIALANMFQFLESESGILMRRKQEASDRWKK